MIIGIPGDFMIVVETQDAYTFSQECNQVSCDYALKAAYVDTYMYKAVFTKKQGGREVW